MGWTLCCAEHSCERTEASTAEILGKKGPKLYGLFAVSFRGKDQDLVALECFAGREPPRRFANSAAQKIA
jgi:hypothetical protein